MATALISVPNVAPRIGRPSGYKPEYCESVLEYFTRERAPRRIEVTSEESDKDGKKTVYRNLCAELPDMTGFCIEVGIGRETLYRWQREHAEFRDACNTARMIGESIAVDRGNNGLYPTAAYQFYMKNVYGWKDKTEIETVASQDTADAGNMREALALMTPEELSQFASIVGSAQARKAALVAASE